MYIALLQQHLTFLECDLAVIIHELRVFCETGRAFGPWGIVQLRTGLDLRLDEEAGEVVLIRSILLVERKGETRFREEVIGVREKR